MSSPTLPPKGQHFQNSFFIFIHSFKFISIRYSSLFDRPIHKKMLENASTNYIVFHLHVDDRPVMILRKILEKLRRQQINYFLFKWYEIIAFQTVSQSHLFKYRFIYFSLYIIFFTHISTTKLQRGYMYKGELN